MRRIVWVGVFVCVVASSGPAWAARTRIHEAAESQEYGRKFTGMIGRGVLNVMTSFVDVLVNTVNETTAGPPFVGTLTGIAKGTGCGVLRLGSGAVDLVTFWVPGFNGFPVSDSYDNCLAANSAPITHKSSSSSWDATPPEPEVAQPPVVPAEKPAKRKWTK